MGANATKKEILKILEQQSITNQRIKQENKFLKIEYNFNYQKDLDEEKNLSSDKKEKRIEENKENKENKKNEKNEENEKNKENEGNKDYEENEENEENDSFKFSFEFIQEIDDPLLDIKNIKKFPYNAIGTISVQFPLREEIFVYTCFLIDKNIVVTLASNLDSKSKGGKAKSIVTSFSKEKVKWENIFIQGEEKLNENSEEDKIPIDSLDNLSSKLAVIIYEDNISNEWLGVEGGKKGDYKGRDIFAVFSFKDENGNNTITLDEKDKNKKSKLREIKVSNMNPFFEVDIKGEKKDIELITQSPGSPLYYNDYNSGAYVIAIITENFEFQYFDRNTMIFLFQMINKVKQIRIKLNKVIEDNDIIELNLEGKNLGLSNIKCLSSFEFKNLRILNLNKNSLKSKGVLYLSQYKLFHSLEDLNLSNNKIGDDGLNHIANGFFYKLKGLYLEHNSITSVGIKYLIKAKFISNLIILSLSYNKKIGDTGIMYMKGHKGWENLSTLILDNTGLTDLALDYIGKFSMPKLKKLFILDNKFTDIGKAFIYALKMNHIEVIYKKDNTEHKEDEKKVDDSYSIDLKDDTDDI